jgi:hypothetical protein
MNGCKTFQRLDMTKHNQFQEGQSIHRHLLYLVNRNIISTFISLEDEIYNISKIGLKSELKPWI